jgi:hypothetical protein
MRAPAAVAIVILSAGRAWAHPPPPPPEIAAPDRPAFEWSSWFRLAYGYTDAAPAATPLASTGTQPPAAPDPWGLHAALGADLTLALASDGDVRLGPWLEVRGFDRTGVVAGGELVIERAPRSLDMFLYDGQGVLIVKAGGNDRVMTGAVAWGYLAPWTLFGETSGHKRYMIGVRLVATATRAVDDPRDWSVTAGLEVEPIGALRYLLGIRSWY